MNLQKYSFHGVALDLLDLFCSSSRDFEHTVRRPFASALPSHGKSPHLAPLRTIYELCKRNGRPSLYGRVPPFCATPSRVRLSSTVTSKLCSHMTRQNKSDCSPEILPATPISHRGMLRALTQASLVVDGSSDMFQGLRMHLRHRAAPQRSPHLTAS